jgi:hypothetical protein
MHAGILARGYEHSKAPTAESVIGGVLLAALITTFVTPASSRAVALAAQAFALLGTVVGLFTIAIGVGPRTIVDLAIHAGFVTALVTGLVCVARSVDVTHAGVTRG